MNCACVIAPHWMVQFTVVSCWLKLRQLSPMKISNPCVVGLTWTLCDAQGEVLDETQDPIEFLVGGSDLLAKLEAALQGLGSGDKVLVRLEPEEAFGEYDEQLVFLEARSLFPKDLEVGMTIEGQALPSGCNPDAPSDVLFTVSDLYPEHVVLDGNHPLAGMALQIELGVQLVRQAKPEEVEKGSAGQGFFRVEPSSRLDD